MTLDHEELQADTGLYVLGALPPIERTRIEEHLRSCHECAASVTAFRAVADSLAYSVTRVDPPPHLRDRILAAAVDARTPRIRLTTAGVEKRSRSTPPTSSRTLVASLGWLAAAASLVAAVVFGMRAANLQSRLSDTELRLREAVNRLNEAGQQLQATQRDATAVGQRLALLTAADTVELRLAGQPPARQASARAFLSRSRGVLFAATNLPQVASGRTYQVWYLTRGAPVSAGLFKPDADGNATAIFDATTIPAFAGMAVSLEPDGGVPAPTGVIYLATQ
jgi:anti-sigma-K factor RskA